MPLLAIVLAPLLAAVAILAMGPWGRRRQALPATVALAVGMGASLAGAVAALQQAVAGEPWTLFQAWTGPIGPDLSLRADAWGSLVAVVVSGVGLAVAVYTRGYFGDDGRTAGLLARLGVFAAAMQLLVLSDDVLLLFVAWELTSVLSYLLVSHTRTPGALQAASTALLVTGLGGLALLAGLCLASWAGDSASLAELAATDLRAHPAYPAILLLVLLGCATKSALFPFHFWLPGAMAAPTPVSTYLHAATMVKAGIVLLARMHPALGGTELWELCVGGSGALTVLVAVARLPGADDLKQLAAFSTLLALGTLAVLLSLDTAQAMGAVAVFLVAHAFYKGTAFLVIGSIDHGSGTRKLSELRGLRRTMPWTAAVAALGAGSMAGLPPFAGFLAKAQVKLAGLGANWLATAAILLGAASLVAVACWLALWPFHGRGAPSERAAAAHESGPGMLVPAALLALAGALLGPAGPWLFDPVVQRVAADLSGPVEVAGLSAFPGSLSKAGATVGLLALGLLGAWKRHAWARVGSLISRDRCVRLWWAAVDGSVALGRRTVATLQHGDLRVSIATTWLVLLALLALVWDGRIPRPDDLGGLQPWVVAPMALAGAGALFATLSRRRLATVAGLGGVGVGVSMLLVGFSAPDAALTLVVAELLTVVLLTLAFRGLPELRPAPAGNGRRGAALVACGVGLLAGLLVLAANESQLAPHLGHQILPRALPDGKGSNAVNVILVDVRALDTLAEIAVLAIAGLGVMALLVARIERREETLRSPVLRALAKALWPVALVTALVLFWRGHNQPGGGFAAGLLIGAAQLLLDATVGGRSARRALPLSPMTLVGGGLTLALVSGLLGLLAGKGFLEPQWAEPIPGLKLGTPLLFDLGVMALVVGMVASAGRLMASAEVRR